MTGASPGPCGGCSGPGVVPGGFSSGLASFSGTSKGTIMSPCWTVPWSALPAGGVEETLTAMRALCDAARLQYRRSGVSGPHVPPAGATTSAPVCASGCRVTRLNDVSLLTVTATELGPVTS